MDDQTTIVVKALNLTWDEFCKQHAGASRAHANEIIGSRPSPTARYCGADHRSLWSAGRRRRQKTIARATRG
jgi:hypothetical protein